MNLRNTHTPWGKPDYAKELAPGITLFGTPSHGGIRLSEERIAALPPALAAFVPFAGRGWYEEDCDWCVPAIAFPEAFEPRHQEAARDTLRNWYPDVYAAHFGEQPTAANSMQVREREAAARLHDHFRPKSAFGSWAWNVPDGHVYVVGRRAADGKELGFLVPKAAYVDLDNLKLDDFPYWEPDRSLPYSKPAAAR